MGLPQFAQNALLTSEPLSEEYLNMLNFPLTLTASEANMAPMVCPVPLSQRHSSQWHCATTTGDPTTVYVTSPHRHFPVYFVVIGQTLLRRQ
jgi:hypothetical protein